MRGGRWLRLWCVWRVVRGARRVARSAVRVARGALAWRGVRIVEAHRCRVPRVAASFRGNSGRRACLGPGLGLELGLGVELGLGLT